MKFDTPATTNPIDQLKVVGKPTDRIDGPLKTTGTAPYAYERHDVAPNQAYGYVVGAAIAKGRIAAIDVDAAKAAPGVLAIVTALECRQARQGADATPPTCSAARRSSTTTRPIALVVAETFEQARAAAHADPGRLRARAGQVRPRREAESAPPSAATAAKAAARRR